MTMFMTLGMALFIKSQIVISSANTGHSVCIM